MIKSKEQFKEAGQELYEALSGPNALRGIDWRGNRTDYYLMEERVARQPLDKPSLRDTISIRSFVASLAIGIANSRGESLDRRFPLEVDVLSHGILIPLRREKTRYLLDEAVRQYDGSNKLLPEGQLLASYVAPSVEFVKAEAAARYVEEGFERFYDVLQNWTEQPQILGVTE